MLWCVSYHLGAFGTVWLPYETRCKTGRTSAKVRATKSRRSFSRRMHPSTPLDPNLMFWCVSYHLGAFGTVRLPYETQGKTGRTSAKVHATKSSRIFFATNASNPTHWNLNSCFGAFLPFWCICDHLVALRNSRQNVPN